MSKYITNVVHEKGLKSVNSFKLEKLVEMLFCYDYEAFEVYHAGTGSLYLTLEDGREVRLADHENGIFDGVNVVYGLGNRGSHCETDSLLLLGNVNSLEVVEALADALDLPIEGPLKGLMRSLFVRSSKNFRA